ncbi:ClpXP protease specificity-enhancing factor [Roseateles saccharophilus]|uniref:Stringent starvation protein B n=1 Tax=Roseateles saccharophilus TaxID=304 RepID=A0A4R3UEW2_ROSSA|nr:ClpXP protease specificity-enhancing factor [Roseateles saccharophilus]MDG0835658.1 ClpXP protease specificity-enhancing factor [Roseateles saccharophilus]TCU85698.1 stringent starvation protein B [Roseateles saccharophilus]
MDKTQGVEGGAGGGTSTRPYLVRALHDWCTDNGFTPYIAVHVDRSVQVPMEYVSNNEIVLNIGFDATSGLDLGNDFIQFKARFGGVAREIVVPVDHVVAIYARENGQGMAFPAPEPREDGAPPPAMPAAEPRRGLRLASEPPEGDADDEPPPDAPSGGTRPALKRVK